MSESERERGERERERENTNLNKVLNDWIVGPALVADTTSLAYGVSEYGVPKVASLQPHSLSRIFKRTKLKCFDSELSECGLHEKVINR